MERNEAIRRINTLSHLKEELDKNISLRDSLVATRESISESAFYQYMGTYENNIKEIEAQIAEIEQIVESIKSLFAKRKDKVAGRIIELDQVIKDTNILYQSKSIDQAEYKRRKHENDLNLTLLEAENKSIHTEEHEFQKLVFRQTSHRTQDKYKEEPTESNSSKFNFIDLIKSNKKMTIVAGSFLLLMTIAVIVIFAGSGYFGGAFDRLSAYQKTYPVRVPVVDNGLLYGFADERGIIVIDAIYDDVRDFSEGYAAVKKNGLWGYINSSGELAIDYQYTQQYVGAFSDGLVRVSTMGKYGFVDEDNSIVIPLEYAYAREYKHGLIPVKVGEKWGYIDRDNNVVVDFIYEAAYTFRDDGLAVVRLDGAEGFIDATGQYLVEPKYDSVKAYNGGLAAVRRNGLWGYMDTNATFVIPNEYQSAYNFDDEVAVVEKGGEFVIIDQKGKDVLNIGNVSSVVNLGSQMFNATSDGKTWKLFNLNGDMKIDNGITIAAINMYGNGSIFRVKTPYGYSLYDYSFSLVMNYYFPYTGVYRYESSISSNESNGYYFFIWYKEETRKYYAFCAYIDDYSDIYPYLDYSEISIRNNRFAINENSISTNMEYDFATDTHVERVTTNSTVHNVVIDGDVLSIGQTYFTRIYTFENTNMYNSLYSNEINRF